jgi:hypothetical protein
MTITLRTQSETGTSTKGSTLTHAELDNNFIDLLQNKIKPIDLRGDTGSQIVGQSLSNEILQVVGGANISTAVTSDSAGQARITITGTGGGASTLDDLTDVTITTPTTGQVLKYNSATSQFVNGTGGIDGLYADPNPSLGGNLTVMGFSIVSSSNGNITITPNGSGSIVLDGLNWPQADGSAGQVLSTNGSGQLSFIAGSSFAAASPGEIGSTTPDVGNFLDVKIKSTNSSAGGTVKELQLYDADNSAYVGFRAPSTVSVSKVYVMPSADGSSNQVLTTDGTGGLSWTTPSGGSAYISWQSSVKTSNFNAVANEGYFCNTNGGVFTATLPGSPTSGDRIAFIDYKGSWNTNNLTVARNGNKIQDDFNDLTASSQKGSVTLIYADATVGWLVQKTVN